MPNPNPRSLAIFLVASAAIPLAVACHAQLKASATLTSGSASASASASLDEPEPPKKPATAGEIVYDKEKGVIDYGGSIKFEYDKAAVQADDETTKVVDTLVTFLKDHPKVKVLVEGHTDNRGSDGYNKLLSRRRANALRDRLASLGVAEDRLSAVGKGKDEPLKKEPTQCFKEPPPKDDKDCEAAWAYNRRVRFAVTEGGDTIKQNEKEVPPSPPEPAPEPAGTIKERPKGCACAIEDQRSGSGGWVLLLAMAGIGLVRWRSAHTRE